MTKKLTALEFERLDRSRLLTELRAKEMSLLEMRSRFVDSQEVILKLQIKSLELDRRIISEDKDKALTQKRIDKEEHEANLETIRKRLKIEGRFGYDPDTLEVVMDEPVAEPN